MELLEQILTDENMNKACIQVIKNKGVNGVDKLSTMDLKKYLEENREDIKSNIRSRTYQPLPVKRVEIPKPEGGVRLLGIPSVVDRMIQQAISQVLTPIYEEQFSENSYGFRPLRSAHMAIEKCLEYLNGGCEWVVDIDLEKFFDKVNHDKLMQIVSETIRDGDVVSLIRKYLVSGIMIDGEYKESVIGTPQGGNLSPLLSNVILDKLDKELESRGLRFVRYADDCLIFVGTERAAERVMKNVTRFIEEKLRLKVNIKKSRIVKPTEVKYLGFGFYKDYSYLYKAKPHQISVQRFKEKIKRLTSRSWGISMEIRLLKLRQLYTGWYHYFKIGSIKTIGKRIDGHTRYRLRMCYWKQWKKTKAKQRELIKLGINKYQAWEWANSRKGYARVAMSHILCRALTNTILAKRGYLSLDTLYQRNHI